MRTFLNGIKNSYFVFYAVTFCGSALTSVSSFLMVEKLFGSISGLGLALALKTAFVALASPFVAKGLTKLSMKSSFWLSQILGLLFLLPLYLGVKLNQPILFIAGITIGGLSTLVLNVVGTAYLKMSSTESGQDFRSNQGKLQLVVGICFTVCSLLSPVLLKLFTYETVLFIDLISYLVGILYIYVHREMFDKWDNAQISELPSQTTESEFKSSIWTRTSISFALIAGSAYALKGLAPMLSGSKALTSGMDIDTTARQTLWAFEALAGIVGGLVYKKFHQKLERTLIFEVGLLSAAILIPIIFIQNFYALAFCVFLLSFTMLLTFMKFRDDFLGNFQTKNSTIWAAGFVNLVSNCVLTLSPLIISLCVSRFSLDASVGIALVFQVCVYAVVKSIGETGKKSKGLTDRLKKIGSAAIISFLILSCVSLILILQSTEKKRAETQIAIWVQSVTKSVIPQLVQNDYVPIYSKLHLLQKTGLFSDFAVYDSDKNLIASLSVNPERKAELHPVLDDAGSTWGYYSYSANPNYWYSSLLFILPILLFAIGILALIARQIFFSRINRELKAVDNFIEAIEVHAEQLANTPNSLIEASPKLNFETVDELHRIRSVVENLIFQIQRRQNRIFENQIAIARSAHQAELSKQVAHDIRSPLAALNMGITGLQGVEVERKAMIESAVRRINGIANDLLDKSRLGLNGKTPNFVASFVLAEPLLEELAAEKEVQYQARFVRLETSFNFPSDTCLSTDPRALSRTISNLLDNAYEVCKPDSGLVRLSGSIENDNLLIEIIDNGSGISPENLEKIGEKGFSTKTKDLIGNGLGVYGAKKFISESSGTFSISSQIGIGTCIMIKLPLAEKPIWLANSIPLSDSTNVVGLDDDLSIHSLWDDLIGQKSDLKYLGFSSVREFEDHLVEAQSTANTLFLIDHNLGENKPTGLQLVIKHKIVERSVLVTSDYADSLVQARCAEIGLRVFAKSHRPRLSRLNRESNSIIARSNHENR